MKRLMQLAALLCPLVQLAFAADNPSVYKWPGSFALDTRSVKAIDTKADLGLIQPIVIKTRDTKVTETAPYTGLKTELEWKAAKDGSGEIVWKPASSGLWTLTRSGTDGSGTARFEVAFDLFHAGEDGTTQTTAYSILSPAEFAIMATSETYQVAVGSYLNIDTAWIKLSDLYAAVSSLGEGDSATPIKYTQVSGNIYQIEDATGESIYTGIWADAPAIGTTTGSLDNNGIMTTEVTGVCIDNRPRTAAEPLVMAASTIDTHTGTSTNSAGATEVLWPFTFGKSEQASLQYLDPASGNWIAMTGGVVDANRPDKSGTLTWAGPGEGGVYRVNNKVTGGNAYFNFPYSTIAGSGTEADPYLLSTTNAFGRLLAQDENLANKYVRLTGSLGIVNLSLAAEYAMGFKIVDPDNKIYQYVSSTGPDSDGGIYETSMKFALSTTAASNETNTRTLSSLEQLLPIRYSGANIWTADNKVEATVATSYASDFEEASLDEVDTKSVTGLGAINFAPEANGLYELTHTSRGETLTARFTVGTAETPAATLWEQTLADDDANVNGDAFRTALQTVGLRDVRLSLDANLANTNWYAGAFQVPAAVTNLVIDLQGKTFAGHDGEVDKAGAQQALVIRGKDTSVTIMDSVGGGVIRGGNGYDADSLHGASGGAIAIVVPEGYNGTITIGDGINAVTVKGGNGGNGGEYGAGNRGYEAINFPKDDGETDGEGEYTAPTLVVKNLASVIGGDGGSSDVANASYGGPGVWMASIDNTTLETETGYLKLTVEEGGTIRGGNGGTSKIGSAGAGGQAVRVPNSDIVASEIVIAQGAEIAGGTAGDAGVTGTVAKGGDAIQGAVTIAAPEGADEDYDPADSLASGETGSYLVTSQSDLDILADNYSSKADGTSLNIKVSEDVAENADLTLDAKLQNATVDLNGQSVSSITVAGETGVKVTDTAETKGSVGTVTTGSGSSVTIADATVTTVDATDANVNVEEGSSVTTLSTNGGSTTVNGGTVTTVNAEGDTSVAVNGGTVSTVTGDEGGNVTVVVASGVTQPAVDENVVQATYLDNSSEKTLTAGTYVLNADITGGFTVTGAATIDMNGYTITGAAGDEDGEAGAPALNVTAAVAVTVKGEGALVGGDGADSASGAAGAGAEAVVAVDGATVTVAETVATETGADGFGADNIPAIKIVKMLQRYPWNGYVDIDYTLSGNLAGVAVELWYTVDGGTATKAEKWIVEPTVEAGTHRMTWNAAAEIVDGYKSDAKVTLKLVRKVAK